MTLGPTSKELFGCSVAGCPLNPIARGLCGKHYQVAYRNHSLPNMKEQEPAKVSVKSWVPAPLEAVLRFHSRKTGLTRSEIIRIALERYLGVSASPIDPKLGAPTS